MSLSIYISSSYCIEMHILMYVAISNNSGNSSDSSSIIGGTVGAVIMTIIVLCIAILCKRRPHGTESPHAYDQVFYDTTKLNSYVSIEHKPSYNVTENEIGEYLYSTINEDSNVPNTTTSPYPVPAMPSSKTSEDKTVRANEFIQHSDVEGTVKMDTNHEISTGEDRATVTDFDTTAYQSLQQYDHDDIHDDPAHNMATDTIADVKDTVQIHNIADQRHHSEINSTMAKSTGEGEHVNQLQSDDPNQHIDTHQYSRMCTDV